VLTSKMYHVEGGVNDRRKRMGKRYVERMTSKVGHILIKGGKFNDEQNIRIRHAPMS